MQNKRKIIFWTALFVFLLCMAFVITWVFLQKRNSNVYERMQSINDIYEVEKAEVTENVTVEQTSEPIEIPIDFKSLQELNPEVYAWIRIPGTSVDYPILQRVSDNSYYLNHTADGVEGLPGSIYTESYNSIEFEDRNTVIYGHDMRDGSMFGGLSNYTSQQYLEEHSTIIIYTPEHIFTYKIFAAVTYDNRHIMNSFDFSNDEGLQAFLDSVYSVRNMYTYIDSSISVSSSDKIITLSTCNGNENQRFLVEAVLIDEK